MSEVKLARDDIFFLDGEKKKYFEDYYFAQIQNNNNKKKTKKEKKTFQNIVKSVSIKTRVFSAQALK